MRRNRGFQGGWHVSLPCGEVHELPIHWEQTVGREGELCKSGEETYKGRRGRFLHVLMALAHSTWDVLINRSSCIGIEGFTGIRVPFHNLLPGRLPLGYSVRSDALP